MIVQWNRANNSFHCAVVVFFCKTREILILHTHENIRTIARMKTYTKIDY